MIASQLLASSNSKAVVIAQAVTHGVKWMGPFCQHFAPHFFDHNRSYLVESIAED